MATESDYKQAVHYLTKLLNGGLLGEKSCTPIRTAIEACELQIPKRPITKTGHQTVALTVKKTLEANAMTDFMRIHNSLSAQPVDND